MVDLYAYSLLTIFTVGLAVIVAATELGYRLGISSKRAGGGSISTLGSAVLGLLALMIGFTFAMAMTRFEARRDAVLKEANSIGTTALRARLLPEPHKTDVLKLINETMKIRVDMVRRPLTEPELTSAIERSNALQEALWRRANDIVAKDSVWVPAGLFIQSLNEMIDNQERRVAEFRRRIPNIVLIALFAIAACGGAFVGYSIGLDKVGRLPVYIIDILVCCVILLILDLDRPSAGFIHVSQQPMIDTAASIAAFSD